MEFDNKKEKLKKLSKRSFDGVLMKFIDELNRWSGDVCVVTTGLVGCDG